MTEALKLPVGIEDFAEIRQAGFYYVDKTKFIEQLLDGWGKVNLFTRPRRFGKTLNMSMLRYFFEIGADASFLFLPCSFYRGFYLSITDKKRLFCLMSTMCLWIRPFRMAIIRKWCHLSAVCSARP